MENTCQSFKRQPHKMVKDTQTVRRLLPTNCLSVFDYFVGLAFKGLTAVSFVLQYHRVIKSFSRRLEFHSNLC